MTRQNCESMCSPNEGNVHYSPRATEGQYLVFSLEHVLTTLKKLSASCSIVQCGGWKARFPTINASYIDARVTQL